jgi:hypothetical protein
MADDRIHRRRHVGINPLATPADDQVGVPPLPLPAQVQIIDAQGRPTADYYQWLVDTHEWHLRLFKFLGGTVRPRPRPTVASERTD